MESTNRAPPSDGYTRVKPTADVAEPITSCLHLKKPGESPNNKDVVLRRIRQRKLIGAVSNALRSVLVSDQVDWFDDDAFSSP
ncbi:hypothetical protein QJS10_CPB17g02560 [Acorus calamus]|uniref:Uncharacterized protein n=1 Tax=Acorus calamus TaxID=4465 RepID=A0AAV9CW85_ACOCL|nr:hypothetical protein QJS10_CPB17g02560 [Acorus calamus]